MSSPSNPRVEVPSAPKDKSDQRLDVERNRHPKSMAQRAARFLVALSVLGLTLTSINYLIGATIFAYPRANVWGGIAAFINLASTVVMAVYAVFLYRLSRDVRDDSTRDGEERRKVTDRQLEVMADQQAAMERMAGAMQVSAEAGRDAAELALRTFTANHPPTIKVCDVRFGTVDGETVTIELAIENTGHSPVTIARVETRDYASYEGEGLLSTIKAMSAPGSNHEGLQGKQLVRTFPIPVFHDCARVTEAALGPPQTLMQMLSNESPTETGTTIVFDVTVAYVDATGGHHRAFAAFYCRPPSRFFRDRREALEIRAAKRADVESRDDDQT